MKKRYIGRYVVLTWGAMYPEDSAILVDEFKSLEAAEDFINGLDHEEVAYKLCEQIILEGKSK